MARGSCLRRFSVCFELAGLAAVLTANCAALAAGAGQQAESVRITDQNGLTAVDDGDTALCTQSIDPPPTATYHIAISDTLLHRFANTGACLYVTDPTATLKGDVVILGGTGGTGALVKFNCEYTADGFRVTNIAFDTPWEDTDPTGVLPGSFLKASHKIAAATNWIYAYVHVNAHGVPAARNLAFCAQGSSGGSSGIDYQISHDGEDAKFDHIILIAASPFTRLDISCNKLSQPVWAATWPAPWCPAAGSGVSDWTPNPTSPVYSPKDASWIGTWTHDSNCGTPNPPHASVTAWEDQSIVSPAEKLSYTATSISVIVCGTKANQTQPLSTYRFGELGQRVSLMLTKDPDFGSYPHFYCDAGGVTEQIDAAGHAWVVEEMNSWCFPKH